VGVAISRVTIITKLVNRILMMSSTRDYSDKNSFYVIKI